MARVSLDGDEVVETRAMLGHHAMIENSDGTFTTSRTRTEPRCGARRTTWTCSVTPTCPTSGTVAWWCSTTATCPTTRRFRGPSNTSSTRTHAPSSRSGSTWTPQHRWTGAMGDVRKLENGNYLIAWSSLEYVNEVTPEGETVWQIEMSDVGTFARVVPMADIYPP